MTKSKLKAKIIDLGGDLGVKVNTVKIGLNDLNTLFGVDRVGFSLS